ncbi:MAG TPA: condensation domain-containing protein [Cellvibrio sp.]|nr:condensation domain-containing protein [Cellvibrio sp.]
MVLTTDVAGHVLQILNIDSAGIAEDANLLEFGLNSLALMQLVDLFRAKYSKALDYTDFVMAPSVAEWTALLNQALAQKHEATIADSGLEAPDTHNNIEVPLADMQYAYWSGRQADNVGAHLYVEFDGKNIDVQRLQYAVDAIFARHGMLRAQVSDDGRQSICKFEPGKGLSLDNCTHLQAGDIDQFLAHKRKRMSHQLLAIASGQVVDISLTLLPARRHRLHIDIDMVAIDPHSFLILVEDLALAYQGELPDVPVDSSDFFNYLELQAQDAEKKAQAESDKVWWHKKLSAMPALPQLPLLPHGLRTSVSSTGFSCHLERDESRSLAAIAQEQNCSLTAVLLGVFSIVLARWSAEPHFRLNFPLFKRKPYVANTNSLIGDFTTFVLLDIHQDDSQSLGELFKAIDQEISVTSAHAAYAGVSLLRDLSKKSHANEIAPVVFTSGIDVGELFSPAVLTTLGHPTWCISQGPKVDLDVQVALCNEQVFINWDVRLDAFKGNSASDMFAAYIAALKQLAEKPLVLMKPCNQVLQEQTLATVEPTKAVAMQERLCKRINEALQISSDKTALVIGNRATSYQQLDMLQTNVCANLRRAGVDAESKILLVVDQPESVSIMIALLAAGICFIPVTADWVARVEQEELNCWLAELGCNFAIGAQAFAVAKTSFSYMDLAKPFVGIDNTCADFQTGFPGQPNPVSYFGVVVDESNRISVEPILRSQLEQKIDAICLATHLEKNHTCLLLSDLASGNSIAGIASALITNAKLIAIESLFATNSQHWRALIKAQAVTHLFAPNARMSALLRQARVGELDSLTHCLIDGAGLSPGAVKILRKLQDSAQLLLCMDWNCSGAFTIFNAADAEQTCGKLTYLAHRPVAGYEFKIVDARGHVCPEWVDGELCVATQTQVEFGGSGNAQQWIDDQGFVWLRTGKFATRIASSDLVFSINNSWLIDRQGYRISSHELTSVIATIDGVYESVLIPREQTSQGIALAVVPDDALVDLNHIKRELGARLPANFIPEPVFLIDELPLDRSGHINKGELNTHFQQALTNASAQSEAALVQASALERTVIYICAQIIGMPSDELSAVDDFFEQGGDSLLATHLTAHLNQYFQGANLTVVDVFSLRSPGNLAELIDGNLPATANQIAEVFLAVIEGE